MAGTLQFSSVLDCVHELAHDIARVSPECADKAMRIVELVGDLDLRPDHGLIQDTIDTHAIDADISDTRVHVTAMAVVRALKGDTP